MDETLRAEAGALAVALAGALAAALAGTGGVAGAPAVAAGQSTTDGWTWPLDPVPAVVAGFVAPSGPFGPGHRGVDLAAATGQPVLSAGPGVVAFAGWVAGRPLVSVDHPGGERTTYEPVQPLVATGDDVASGQALGTLAGGQTHCLPATCLHWGLRVGPDHGTYRDPLSLLGAVPVRLLPLRGVPPVEVPPADLPPGLPPALPRDRGPLLAAGRVRAAKGGRRRAVGSRLGRCRPERTRGGSRAPPTS